MHRTPLHQERAALLQRHRLSPVYHLEPALHEVEGLEFLLVVVGWAGLASLEKEVLSTVSALDLVRDPELNLSDSSEIAKTEIEDQRLDIGHDKFPLSHLLQRGLDRTVGFLTNKGNFYSLFQLFHVLTIAILPNLSKTGIQPKASQKKPQ